MYMMIRLFLFEIQGTLMAFTAFSGGKVFNMLRSAAMLSPIAHMRQVNSPIARIFADQFVAEVRHKQHHLNFNSFIEYNLSLMFFFFNFLNVTASWLNRPP